MTESSTLVACGTENGRYGERQEQEITEAIKWFLGVMGMFIILTVIYTFVKIYHMAYYMLIIFQ